MFSIKTAAEKTGLNPITIRAWERRYGIAVPVRDQNGYRSYQQKDLDQLTKMSQLLAGGMKPAKAAQQILGATNAKATTLVQLAQDFNEIALWQLLEQKLNPNLAVGLDEWLFPELIELGKAWKTGEISVAAEHFTSEIIRSYLGSEIQRLSITPHIQKPKILIGLASQVHHELGILSYQLVVRKAGYQTRYLGSNIPEKDWLTAISVTKPDLIVTAVPQAADIPNTLHCLNTIRTNFAIPIAVGGGQQNQFTGQYLALGHKFQEILPRTEACLVSTQHT